MGIATENCIQYLQVFLLFFYVYIRTTNRNAEVNEAGSWLISISPRWRTPHGQSCVCVCCFTPITFHVSLKKWLLPVLHWLMRLTNYTYFTQRSSCAGKVPTPSFLIQAIFLLIETKKKSLNGILLHLFIYSQIKHRQSRQLAGSPKNG